MTRRNRLDYRPERGYRCEQADYLARALLMPKTSFIIAWWETNRSIARCADIFLVPQDQVALRVRDLNLAFSDE